MSEVLLEAVDLRKHFAVRAGVLSNIKGYVKAVDGISLSISKGETFGLVGESGCGKSTLGRLLLRLIEPTSGKCLINGENIYHLKEEQLRKLRRDIQIIFQDPYASLNPKMTIGKTIEEPMKIFNIIADKSEREEKVKELLEIVGLSRDHYGRFPHEFSGGQRQRISIARALALKPKLIVCDEAVSALDVSIRSQILNLLKDLQEEFNLTYVFISHDLSVVKYICDRIGVMYLGKIVEMASSADLFRNPSHPYTKALLSAIPEPNPKKAKDRVILKGDVPNPINPPEGCVFHPRCIYASERCRTDIPYPMQVCEGHYASCHLIGI